MINGRNLDGRGPLHVLFNGRELAIVSATLSVAAAPIEVAMATSHVRHHDRSGGWVGPQGMIGP